MLPGSALVTIDGVSIVLIDFTDATDFATSCVAGLIWGRYGGCVRRRMRKTGSRWRSWVLGHYLAIE
jgi:hypothetical protein